MLILLAAGAYYLWPKNSGASTTAGTAKGAGKNGRGGAVPPVVAAKVRKGNIGVYYTGLGAVTPIYTVTVKSRVDGQLMKVHYKEGELVQQGDLLVEIDPRPYQVQLTQAEGSWPKTRRRWTTRASILTRYQTLLDAECHSGAAAGHAESHGEAGRRHRQDRPGAVIDSAKLNITYCHITAPITGRVGLRLVDPGNIVHASDANGLLVITQIQPISVIFTIAEDQLPAVLQENARRADS